MLRGSCVLPLGFDFTPLVLRADCLFIDELRMLALECLETGIHQLNKKFENLATDVARREGTAVSQNRITALHVEFPLRFLGVLIQQSHTEKALVFPLGLDFTPLGLQADCLFIENNEDAVHGGAKEATKKRRRDEFWNLATDMA